MTLLGVNVDHVATLRNARGGREPDPLLAALVAEQNGADSIVCHLREDRRHIRERDLFALIEAVQTFVQLEMAPAARVVTVALKARPREVMIVPERRQELTTEGGFDCVALGRKLKPVIARFRSAGIGVSVFVDAEPAQVKAAAALGAETVELHTGPYCHGKGSVAEAELRRLEVAAQCALDLGLHVHAGHGLNYQNAATLVRSIPVEKVNIGHSIVSRAVFTGFGAAVREMKALVAGG
ncbi:MAG: pyridoxine 5'-phosphate synthase [Planctomycetes bacterium]|nr:pyridoxine 5'-phosphate synthase [Planctomycetota bacterium]